MFVVLNVKIWEVGKVVGATKTGIAAANDDDICLTIKFQGAVVFHLGARRVRPIAVRQRQTFARLVAARRSSSS